MKSRKSMGCVLFLTSLKLIVYPLHLQTSIKMTEKELRAPYKLASTSVWHIKFLRPKGEIILD